MWGSRDMSLHPSKAAKPAHGPPRIPRSWSTWTEQRMTGMIPLTFAVRGKSPRLARSACCSACDAHACT
eukprot:3108714-Lingulodinium_polyedra.AAC.1